MTKRGVLGTELIPRNNQRWALSTESAKNFPYCSKRPPKSWCSLIKYSNAESIIPPHEYQPYIVPRSGKMVEGNRAPNRSGDPVILYCNQSVVLCTLSKYVRFPVTCHKRVISTSILAASATITLLGGNGLPGLFKFKRPIGTPVIVSNAGNISWANSSARSRINSSPERS